MWYVQLRYFTFRLLSFSKFVLGKPFNRQGGAAGWRRRQSFKIV